MKRNLLDVVVSYDIVNDRQRAKIAELLKDTGVRVQYSVFEMTLKPREFRTIRSRIERLMKSQTDSIRYYILCRNCLAERIVVQRSQNRRTKARA